MKLFLPDNFSQTEIKYKLLIKPPVFLPEVLNNFFANYEIKEIYRLDRPEINSENYKIFLRVSGRNQAVLLKKHKILKNSSAINFYLTLIDELARGGVKVSRIIKTLRGRMSVEAAGENYSLFEFIEASYFIPKKIAFINIAEEIARLHKVFNNLSDSYLKPIDAYSQAGQTYFNKIKEYKGDDFVSLVKVIKKNSINLEIEKKLTILLPKLAELADEMRGRQKIIAKLPWQIIHSDLHPHNVLMKDGEVLAIVDFDAVRISQQARDAAFAIYRFGRQFYVSSAAEANNKMGVDLKNLFIKNYNQIKPLSSQEIALMPLLIKDDFIRKILFVLRGVYLENNFSWAKDLPKFMAAFEEIDYFWPN